MEKESERREETEIAAAVAPQKSLGKPPWNPMDFIWIAIVFSFGASGILAGLNWRRLGKPQRTWSTIILSLAGLVGVVAVSILLPAPRGVAQLAAYAANIGIAVLLMHWQNSSYEEWIAAYGRPTRKESGCLIPVTVGIGVTLAVALFAFLLGFALSTLPANRAIDHFNQAVEYQQKGQLDSAIEYYSKAIALDSQFADAYVNRGKAYLDRDDFERAIADFDAAIAIDPQDPLGYRNRGIAYLLTAQFDRALVDLNKAIELGDEPSALFVRGIVYINLEKREKAIADLERALELGLEPTQQRDAEAFLKELNQ